MSDAQAPTLFLVSLGPVQSFIASARKTSDLWAGSYLLSHLVRRGVDFVDGVEDAKMIFPVSSVIDNSDGLAVFPNRLLFSLANDRDDDALHDLGKEITNVISTSFSEIIQTGVEDFCRTIGTEVVDFNTRQLQDFLEIFWVALPPDDRSYNERYQSIENGLAARKNLRHFKQPEPEQGLKCSLCGEREALHRENDHTPARVKTFWKQVANNHTTFRSNEYLCAICLGKRFAPYWFRNNENGPAARFPSTAEVSASSWKAQWLRNAPERYKEFQKQVKPLVGLEGCLLPRLVEHHDENRQTIDSHWLYKENYTDKELQAQKPELDADDHDTLRNNFSEFCNKPPDNINKLPSSYFAVLMLDGDRIGPKLKQVENQNAHREFSLAMADFANGPVGKIVEQDHLGKLIYTGGDDLLALVNPVDLLSVMEQLRHAFSNHFINFSHLYGNFTASCGVCISHYKNPLHVTVSMTRNMEQLAKHGYYSRNGFAVAVLTHSGSIRQSAAHWEFTGEYGAENTLNLLQDFQQFLDQKILSNRFVYRLKESVQPLTNRDGIVETGVRQAREEMLTSEFYRLLRRNSDAVIARAYVEALPPDAGYSCPELLFHEFALRLTGLFRALDYNLGDLLALLEITSFINREALT